jgi:hypothetical protein
MGNRPADPLELLVGDNSADLVAGLAFVPQLLFQIGLDLCQLVYIGGGIGERVSLAVVLINNGSDTVNGFILFWVAPSGMVKSEEMPSASSPLTVLE